MHDWTEVIASTSRVNRRRMAKARLVKATGCREWTGAMGKGGYGYCAHGPAHRWAWVECRGPVPAGLEVDHLCSNRKCIEITHLDVCSHAENQARGAARRNQNKTHCKYGHPFSIENTLVNSLGHRVCRLCRNASVYRWAKNHPKRWAAIQEKSIAKCNVSGR